MDQKSGGTNSNHKRDQNVHHVIDQKDKLFAKWSLFS